jgi:iron complex transport system substrate-binding protein
MIRCVGELTGTQAQAERIAQDIDQAFAGLKPLPQAVRAAYLIWRKPYMAAGSGTFIHDLMERCGLVNVFDDRERAIRRSRQQELAEADPGGHHPVAPRNPIRSSPNRPAN